MKRLYVLLIFVVGLLIQTNAQSNNPTYNRALADSLGADKYGMKLYVLVILKTGSVHIEDTARVLEIFRGHMSNITRLADEGKLIVAGPLMKNPKAYRGLFIFNTTKAEAQPLLETDPAIKEKLLEAELYEWYGSAALPTYLNVHQQIEKEKP